MTLDHEKKSVVVSVRGTVSMKVSYKAPSIASIYTQTHMHTEILSRFADEQANESAFKMQAKKLLFFLEVIISMKAIVSS